MVFKGLILAILFLFPFTSFAQWTEVQKNWNSTAGASPATTTVSLTSVVANHTVVTSVVYLGTATGFTMVVTDGAGHSFTATPNSPCIYPSGEKIWLFYLLSAVAGNMTVTATPSIAHGISVHAIEFIPATGIPSFDSDACANPTSGTTPINTPSITPVRAGVLYAAALTDPNVGAASIAGVGAGWTEGTRGVIASDSNDSSDEYQFSATGATAVNWTTTGSAGSGWVAMSMSLTSVQISSIDLKGNVKFKGNVKIK